MGYYRRRFRRLAGLAGSVCLPHAPAPLRPRPTRARRRAQRKPPNTRDTAAAAGGAPELAADVARKSRSATAVGRDTNSSTMPASGTAAGHLAATGEAGAQLGYLALVVALPALRGQRHRVLVDQIARRTIQADCDRACRASGVLHREDGVGVCIADKGAAG